MARRSEEHLLAGDAIKGCVIPEAADLACHRQLQPLDAGLPKEGGSGGNAGRCVSAQSARLVERGMGNAAQARCSERSSAARSVCAMREELDVQSRKELRKPMWQLPR